MKEFQNLSSQNDGLGLLRAIKTTTYQFESRQYPPHALHTAKRRFFLCSQGKATTVASHYETFRNMVEIINQSGGSLGSDEATKKIIAKEEKLQWDSLTHEQATSIESAANERYLATAFLLSSDRIWFAGLITSLQNDYSKGINNYPKTLTDAVGIMSDYKRDPNTLPQKMDGSDGMNYTNIGDNNPSSNDSNNKIGNTTMATEGKPAWSKDKSTHTCC